MTPLPGFAGTVCGLLDVGELLGAGLAETQPRLRAVVTSVAGREPTRPPYQFVNQPPPLFFRDLDRDRFAAVIGPTGTLRAEIRRAVLGEPDTVGRHRRE